MVTINLLEGVRPPLPPATPREILEVCSAAVTFCVIAAGVTAGVVFLLNRFLF